MPSRFRYIVLGTIYDASRWRMTQGVPLREVLMVSTSGPHALRGRTFGPDVEVVTLPSWAAASDQVKAETAYQLRLTGAASAKS